MDLSAVDFDSLTKRAAPSEGRSDQFTCKNGVIVNLKKIKGQIIRDMYMQIKKPVMPQIRIEEKGGRMEDNPNDPDYQLQMAVYNSEIVSVSVGATIIFGTSIKYIPEGVAGVDDDWDAELIEFGLNVRAKGTKSRYVDWLKYVVFEDDEEMGNCINAVRKISGLLSEEETAAAEETFPRS